MYRAKLKTLLPHRRWFSSDVLLVVTQCFIYISVCSLHVGGEIICDNKSSPLHLLEITSKLVSILCSSDPLISKHVRYTSVLQTTEHTTHHLLSNWFILQAKLPKVQSILQDATKANGQSLALTDTFGRHHTYLRISLTERCNLRCK